MKKILTLFLFSLIMSQNNNYKIDFGKDLKETNWSVVNDGVMGGLSKGSATLTNNSVLFKGTVSLDNNGGFSSLRSSFFDKDLSKFTSVKIKYRSTGISLAISLAVSRRWYVPNYKMSLNGTNSKWEIKTINLLDFRKHYIGKPMNETLDKKALKEIIRIGFITDEKKYGDFEFEIDYLEFQ